MKFNPVLEKEILKDFGFEYVTEMTHENLKGYYTDKWGHYDYYFDQSWVLVLSYGRRGQQYYIIVDDTNEVSIYASHPDGSGGPGELRDEIVDLIMKGIFVK